MWLGNEEGGWHCHCDCPLRPRGQVILGTELRFGETQVQDVKQVPPAIWATSVSFPEK